VWTAVGQEASTESKGQQTPAATKPQPEAAAPRKSESETPTAKTEAAVTPAPSQPVGPVIQNRRDKISYAFGMDLARDLERQKNDLNVDLLMRALKDALADKPLLMTDDEVTATLKQLEAEQKQD